MDHKFKKNVGKRLKDLRKRNKWSVDKLISIIHKETGVYLDEKTIRRYEAGENLPKTENLIALSKVFNVSLDDIIFNKESTDDNSFTFEDNFKRLNRLIYSLMLIPVKETNPDSKYYDKYYFTTYDEEICVYLDRLYSYNSDKCYTAEVLNKDPNITIQDYDKLIGDFREDKTDLSPSMERVAKILLNQGVNPEEYLKNHLIEVEQKRRK